MRGQVLYWFLALGWIHFETATCVSAGLPERIERVKSSIVAVGTYQKTRNPAFVFRGTGFAVGDGTLIATNAHVLPDTLAEESHELLVVLGPQPAGQQGQPRQARAIAVEKSHDIALLKVSGGPFPPLPLYEPAVVEGEVFAFTGFPLGSILGLAPVTHRAMVSSVTSIALPTVTQRQLDSTAIRRLRAEPIPIFQLEATAYPGNSGSPLYDIETGGVVGIINMVFVTTTREKLPSPPSGLTFAIPVRYLRELLNAAAAR